MNVWLQKMQDKWWLCLISPVGLVIRLSTSYSTEKAALNAAAIYGFDVVPKPASVPETEAELRRIATQRRITK